MDETYGYLLIIRIYINIQNKYLNYINRRGYEEHVAYEQPSYDTYHSHHGPGAGISATVRGPYDAAPEYDGEYNRRDFYQHSPGYGGLLLYK